MAICNLAFWLKILRNQGEADPLLGPFFGLAWCCAALSGGGVWGPAAKFFPQFLYKGCGSKGTPVF